MSNSLKRKVHKGKNPVVSANEIADKITENMTDLEYVKFLCQYIYQHAKDAIRLNGFEFGVLIDGSDVAYRISAVKIPEGGYEDEQHTETENVGQAEECGEGDQEA